MIATAWGVDPHDVMLALGWVTPEDYVVQLAAALQVDHIFGGRLSNSQDTIDATAYMPSDVARLILSRGLHPDGACLTSGYRPEADLTPKQRRRRCQRAIDRLLSVIPMLSAASRQAMWQPVFLTVGVGSLIGAAFVDRMLAYFILTFLAAIPFFFVVAQRFTAFVVYCWHPRPKHANDIGSVSSHQQTSDLPIYSLLVPLFREGEVLPDILSALTQLNYPAAKLDVILVLEESDLETQRYAETANLPGFVKLLVVPDMHPQTKPKALNYAIQFTKGEFVVVYDAEDVPAPDQLTAALKVFDRYPEIDCLQAQLSIHNADESWLAAQFALEYTALFCGLLPALERMQVPLPLGGTSNHFRRHALLASGLWDPFNVTEDADLGIRLARQGRRIGVLNSTTWEEAPAELSNWLPQRTRWIKGWLQTYLVHTRNPGALLRDLGFSSCLGFHWLIGGFLLSVFLHPLFYLIAAIELLQPIPFQAGPGLVNKIFWWLALFNLAVGTLTAMAFAILAAVRQKRWDLVCCVPLMPIYWLLVSLAAYRAAYQLVTAPYHWEKTRHKARWRNPPQQ